MWYIWKARCTKVFHDMLVEVLTEIWIQSIHTMRGNYDAIHRSPNNIITQHLAFHAWWKESPPYTCSLMVSLGERTPLPIPSDYFHHQSYQKKGTKGVYKQPRIDSEETIKDDGFG